MRQWASGKNTSRAGVTDAWPDAGLEVLEATVGLLRRRMRSDSFKNVVQLQADLIYHTLPMPRSAQDFSTAIPEEKE